MKTEATIREMIPDCREENIEEAGFSPEDLGLCPGCGCSDDEGCECPEWDD